jgi:urease accessory protein
LTVDAGGALEWLPQETILYDGAEVEIDTRIELGAQGRFFGAETLVFGLPARGEPFVRGSCRPTFELRREGAPILIERGRFDGGAAVQAASWGLGGASVLTLIVAAPAPDDAVVEELRALAAASGDAERAGVTVLGDRAALVVRHLGARAESARAFVLATWRRVRPQLFGRAAVPPRIWAT